jgi:hypothetical protein
VLVDKATGQVLCVHVAHGKVHDLRLFKQSGLKLASDTILLGDKGYLGIAKDHSCSRTPYRRPPKGSLSPEQKQHNRVLARLRIKVEHVIRTLKVFRILSERYRNRRRRFGLRLNLIAALCNLGR